jgi:ribonuclease R
MSAVKAILGIAKHHGVRPEHSAVVQAEADALARAPGIDDPELLDLTHLPFCTIDEYTSMDLDQALHVAPSGDGWLVHYAIADAAYFVRPGTALFADALRRGSSFYLPGLVSPMLPRVLSEDVVSLNADVDRRALVFRVALDRDGEVIDTVIQRARMRSRAKLAWEQVQAFYDGGPPPLEELGASLEGLAAVGALRMTRAEERDVLRLRRREMALGMKGLHFVATSDLRADVERFNEQVSLLCNMEGARFLREGLSDIHPIYRVHAPPAEVRIAELHEAIDGIVTEHRSPAHERVSGESLATYLARLPQDRVSRAIHRQAMRSSGRATFSKTPGPHHGIGADVYARFTAPMREIVGVFVHKEATEQLGLQAPHTYDEQLREQVIAASTRARHVQRALDQDVNRLVVDAVLGTPGPHRGTVMGVSRRAVHIQLDEPPIDVKAYLAYWPRARTTATSVEVQGMRIRVGDAIVVKATLDPVAKRWRLDVVP